MVRRKRFASEQIRDAGCALEVDARPLNPQRYARQSIPGGCIE
jgi:hypothetical protein